MFELVCKGAQRRRQTMNLKEKLDAVETEIIQTVLNRLSKREAADLWQLFST